MDWRLIKFILGRIFIILGGLMILPLMVSLYYQEDFIYTMSFLITGILTVSIGWFLSRKPISVYNLYVKESMVIVALAWVLISFIGAIPYTISGLIPSFIDAFFESVSGFTTTGASILSDVEALPNSMLFWRSSTLLIGGMGVLVFVLAILPNTHSSSVNMMKAEVPGPTFGKLVSKLSESARILYIIYFVMTVITVICLLLAGVPFFDALLLGFGAAGTGGFAVKNGSVLPYDSIAVEAILGISMLMFGMNFTLFYLLIKKEFKRVFESEELRWYLSIVAISIVLITLNLSWNDYPLLESLRHTFFSVSSVITTTAYSTVFFENWPLFSQMILLLLMFTGGMAGSTAGGLKVSRIAILFKSARAQILRVLDPNRVVTVTFENKPLKDKDINSVSNYFVVYVLLFSFMTILISLDTPNFITAFSSIAATINNIGPGLGLVGPASNYASFSNLSKIVLSFAMLIGRLEIYPVLLLFMPSTWTKKI